MGAQSGRTSGGGGRLGRLPRRVVAGIEVPVATSVSTRLLGLSYLDRDDSGTGLLIPRCRSVHTFGMCFPINVLFLDVHETVIRCCPAVPPRRCLFTRGADSVLELVPSGHEGGEVLSPVA